MKRIRKLLTTVAVILALSLLLSSAAFATNATVATDGLNMRDGGSLSANVIDTLPRGAVVTVNFDAGYGWYQVTYNGKTGYMAGYYLLMGVGETEQSAAEAPVASEQPAAAAPQAVTTTYTAPASGSGNGIIRGTDVRLRSGPSMNSETITYLGNDTAVNVHGACGNWYEVDYNGSNGYVYGDYVVLNGQSVTYTLTAAVTTEDTEIYTEPVTDDNYITPVVPAPVEPEPVSSPVIVEPAPAPVPYNAVTGQLVVDTAMKYLGIPYVWAGTSPDVGFDCSGLVYYVYQELGYTLNRVAQSMYYDGTDVDLNDIRPGDILLFGSSVYNIWHAAIYVGSGNFIHAPYSGQVVSIQALSATYGMRLVAARRIV
jgi:cell wall-associated NlpC family hydrolase